MSNDKDKSVNANSIYRVERTVINSGCENYKAIHRACQITRRIKNRTHYLIRHSKKLFGQNKNHRAIDKHLKKHEPVLYEKHPSALAQRSTQICGAEWSSYFEALKMFKVAPEKFKAQPRPPKYAKGATTTCLGRNGFCVKSGLIHFPKKLSIQPIPTQKCVNQVYNVHKNNVVISEVRFVPLGTSYVVEVVYGKQPQYKEGDFCPLYDKNRVLGIDIGLDNLAAMITNQPDIHPVLINGKTLKSINALYNKQCADLRAKKKGSHLLSKSRKRYHAITDYMHKASRFIVNFCETNNLGKIVIGKNDGWKQGINIGKRNNQNFVSIPHAGFIGMIRYKAEQVGIKVIVREESYTSKASFLDKDTMPAKHDLKYSHSFSGKRIKRSLYRSKNGQIIHADIQAAGNIVRKELGDEVFDPLFNKGCVFQPIRESMHAHAHPKVFRIRRVATQAESRLAA